MRKIFFVTLACLLTVFVGQSFAEGLYGTGNNYGSGWRPDGNGGYIGTGNNYGSGWRSDGNGGYIGTGNNYGSGYRSGY